MKKLVAAFLALAPFVAFADSSLTWVKMSGSAGSFYATSLKIGEVKKFLGKTDLAVYSFAGLGARNRVVTGLSLGYDWRVAQDVTLTLGPAVAITSGKPVDIGVSVGVVWKF